MWRAGTEGNTFSMCSCSKCALGGCRSRGWVRWKRWWRYLVPAHSARNSMHPHPPPVSFSRPSDLDAGQSPHHHSLIVPSHSGTGRRAWRGQFLNQADRALARPAPLPLPPPRRAPPPHPRRHRRFRPRQLDLNGAPDRHRHPPTHRHHLRLQAPPPSSTRRKTYQRLHRPIHLQPLRHRRPAPPTASPSCSPTRQRPHASAARAASSATAASQLRRHRAQHLAIQRHRPRDQRLFGPV